MTTKRDIARKEAQFYGREALRAIIADNEPLREQVRMSRDYAMLAARAAREYLKLKADSERSAAVSEAYRSCGMKRTPYGWE